MIGIVKKVPVVPLQSEANANYNPFPNDTTNATDIQAIKTAFLADPDVLEALKGDDGQTGEQGPAGDSVIVRDTDPTDAISSKVGDLYLNTTSGTLYQRSGITQSQFYAAGLQGLVLPNSIWIRKGNLKGANGDKGDNGENGLPIVKIGLWELVEEIYPSLSIGQIGILPDFTLIKKIAEPIGNLGVSQIEILGNIKGETGKTGETGTKIFSFDTLLEFEENVFFAEYRVDDLFLILENGTLYKKTTNTIPPNATNQAYYTTVTVLKGAKGDKGDKGDDGENLSQIVIISNYSQLNNQNFIVSHQHKTIIVSELSGIHITPPIDNSEYVFIVDYIAPSFDFGDSVTVGNEFGTFGNDKFEILPTQKAYVRMKSQSNSWYNIVVNITPVLN